MPSGTADPELRSQPAKSTERKQQRAREGESGTPASVPPAVRTGPMGIVNREVEAARLQPGTWHADLEKAAIANGSADRLPAIYQADPQKLREDFPDAPPQLIQEIQKAFEQAAGVGELDPASPEYLQRWRQAALTTTIRMRTLYGWNADAEMQRKALMEEMGMKGE